MHDCNVLTFTGIENYTVCCGSARTTRVDGFMARVYGPSTRLDKKISLAGRLQSRGWSDYQRPSDHQNCHSLHSSASSRPTCLFQLAAAVSVVYRCPIGAVVTVQRVRRRLQMSRLDSTIESRLTMPPRRQPCRLHPPPRVNISSLTLQREQTSILRHTISKTTKKTNEWVPNKAGVKRELLDTS